MTKLISFLFFLGFLIIGIYSLSNYGQNWDESTHFARGQSFLHFFLTGKKDFSDLPLNYRKSFYQQDIVNNFNFYVRPERAAHPPISDTLAAFSNYIFYQKLNILGDIESYHLYSVLLSSLLIGAIVYFTGSYFGNFAGIISGLSLLLYPFFLGESNFNIKDFPETFFYSLFIITFWVAIKKRKIFWIFICSIFFGLGLGTKFNIFFAGLTVFIWFMIYTFDEIKNKGVPSFLKNHWCLILSFVLIPVVGSLLFYITWPFLWVDTVNRVKEVFIFYKDLSDTSLDPRFLLLNGFINFYPILWIATTTPIIILILGLTGFIRLLRKLNPSFPGLLLLIWLLIPILRVSIVHSYIYGGIRHIMEYIPVLAIIAGVGGDFIIKKIYSLLPKNKKQFRFLTVQKLQFFVILLFIPITIKIISIYPNESVYFNPLIGGLKGAKEKNIPGWGNSLGSTYRQAINWINKNAEKNSKLSLVFELRSNVPMGLLRHDILFNVPYRSGTRREGEYLVGVTHEGFFKDFYNYKYSTRFLNPLWELKVDDVPILEIWKNDIAHSNPEYLNENLETGFSVKRNGEWFSIDFNKIVKITKLELDYGENPCEFPKRGAVQISDDRLHWTSLPGSVEDFPRVPWFDPLGERGKFSYIFAADQVLAVRISNNGENSCFFKDDLKVKVWDVK